MTGILERLPLDKLGKTPKAISLMARKGSARDVGDCYALHESLRLPYAQTSSRILPEMWRALLSNGAMQLFLVEDRARPSGSRIVSFSAAVFVTDEFCAEARLTLPPYLGVDELGDIFRGNCRYCIARRSPRRMPVTD